MVMNEATEKVIDRLRGHDDMEKFNSSDIGGEFWDLFNEIVDSNDSMVFLLKLKHKMDELIEDQVLYCLANALSQ